MCNPYFQMVVACQTASVLLQVPLVQLRKHCLIFKFVNKVMRSHYELPHPMFCITVPVSSRFRTSS